MNKTLYYSADDVQELLGVGRSKAYGLIRDMNSELQKMDYIVIPGKVPKKYFLEHCYGGTETKNESVAV